MFTKKDMMSENRGAERQVGGEMGEDGHGAWRLSRVLSAQPSVS